MELKEYSITNRVQYDILIHDTGITHTSNHIALVCEDTGIDVDYHTIKIDYLRETTGARQKQRESQRERERYRETERERMYTVECNKVHVSLGNKLKIIHNHTYTSTQIYTI